MRRIKILAGLAAASILVLGIAAWQLRGPANDPADDDLTVSAETVAPVAETAAQVEETSAPAGDEAAPILLADGSGEPMDLYEDDHVLGNPDAPITIIEFASLTCPHCAAFHNDILPQIKTDYIDAGLAKLVYRNFPLDQLALYAAMMVECAPADKYFNLLGVLFRTQEEWGTSAEPVRALEQIGRTAGLSADQITACTNDEAAVQRLLTRAQEGQDKYDVQSTPSFVINGQIVKGALPYEEFDEILRNMVPKS
ncbi:MAG: DsbA family protein [Rhodospirillaceae bacterium]|nr:DsbA family protein [Rhodospirillaceae bacterium]